MLTCIGSFIMLKGPGFKAGFWGEPMPKQSPADWVPAHPSPTPQPGSRLLQSAELGCIDFNENVRQSYAVALRDLQIITKPAVG